MFDVIVTNGESTAPSAVTTSSIVTTLVARTSICSTFAAAH
jgi:hypothetical protein